jgi:predicted O-linked N-acetylglucosamine transferase (SPINDLY family)/glycosyltransferase involved in cell wall biosynthesis
MQDSSSIIREDFSDSPEKTAFILAEKGALELIELMGAADRLKSAGLKDQTISLYRLWLENTTSSLSYVGYFNLGVELASEREYIQAETLYRKALELCPDFTRARLNLGNCLEQLKRDDEALEQWRIALETKSILLPENLSLQLHALNNLGRLLEMKKNYKDSLAKLEESFALDPTQRDVLLHLVHLVQKICRWPIYTPPKGITKEEMISGTSPLAMLAASDDPKLQLTAAQQFVEHKYPVTSTESLAPESGYKHSKIRIGYLSSDFCLHAVSLLMVELLELHDHDQFEVYGFCWSRIDDTSIQKRVQNSMDHYIKIGEMSDKEAADCIRSHEIDIIVDLQGLTSGARPMILSYRPATIQITYLGFPGTTGLPWIDYVIADKFLIPDELIPYHTEKPLYLPNCFQSSDSKREVGPMPTRADNGLPEKAFVFCSFNNNYKFTPELFAVWMRIIKRVPGSVFWLLADNEWAKENLINTAKKLGIKKDRLIFAPRVAPADYLARYQLADLFLDTFPFNGGTTANDALFMGLPLLTLSGRTFASRMAGSLLTNLGLPELIASSMEEYEEKAVRLAKRTGELKTLKSRLIESKSSGPVFDIVQVVKNIESQFCQLIDKLPAKPGEPATEPSTRGIVESSLPLVSIVIPTHNRPDYFELALKSSLAQDYKNIEIIVSDNSDDDLTLMRIAPYLKKYPSINYSRVPGHTMLENFKNCFDLSAGEYINFLMDDDLFHPEKISKMIAHMHNKPNIGLVTSFRQLIDENGKYMDPIPGTERMFASATLIGGISLGEHVLSKGNNLIGEPTTALFRKADIGKGFGKFIDKEYWVLTDVATWLSVLSHKDCVYLPEPLSYFRIHGGQDQRTSAIKLKACVEWLQLFCDAHEHNKFLFNRPAIHDLLTSKLVTAMWFLSSEHEKIKAGAYELGKIQNVIRQATAILLSKSAKDGGIDQNETTMA